MTDRYGRLLIGFIAAAIAGCDSGSFGSDVGDKTNAAPLAEVQILNGNGTNRFRTGAEVLLSGKASEDPDGPILSYRWEYLPQAGQPCEGVLAVHGEENMWTRALISSSAVFLLAISLSVAVAC